MLSPTAAQCRGDFDLTERLGDAGGHPPADPVDVVQVMASGDVGGGAEHLAGMIAELQGRGIRSAVVVGPEGHLAERLERSGLQVFRLPMMGARGDVRVARRLGRLLRGIGAPVVHAHGTRAGLLVALSGVRPYVYTAHGLAFSHGGRLVQPVRRLAEVIVCRGAVEVISVSSGDLANLRRTAALSRSKGIHIPNALDTVRFSPGERQTAREESGLPPEATLIGTVGRLVPQKGVDVLIDAMRTVPHAELVIAGDGPLRPELEARAAAAGVTARFLGLRHDVPAVLRSLDVFVLPSRWEGEPIALLEALACEIPVVASRLPGVEEIVGDSHAAILVPARNAGAIAAAVSRLLDDPRLASRIATEGRARALTRSWAESAAQLHAVYARVAPST